MAALEFKSQVGPSFGNNFNNRTEEAIGTAHDLWTAYREGAFGKQPRPFVGWLMMVEDAPASRRAITDRSPHFPVFKEFQGASYLQRYNILCQRLMKEQLYSAACVITSPRTASKDGAFMLLEEPTCSYFRKARSSSEDSGSVPAFRLMCCSHCPPEMPCLMPDACGGEDVSERIRIDLSDEPNRTPKMSSFGSFKCNMQNARKCPISSAGYDLSNSNRSVIPDRTSAVSCKNRTRSRVFSMRWNPVEMTDWISSPILQKSLLVPALTMECPGIESVWRTHRRHPMQSGFAHDQISRNEGAPQILHSQSAFPFRQRSN